MKYLKGLPKQKIFTRFAIIKRSKRPFFTKNIFKAFNCPSNGRTTNEILPLHSFKYLLKIKDNKNFKTPSRVYCGIKLSKGLLS